MRFGEKERKNAGSLLEYLVLLFPEKTTSNSNLFLLLLLLRGIFLNI
jgi:hypothetical protein